MSRTITMQQRHTIGSGNGVLFIGPVGGVNPNSWPDYSNLQEVGSLEGDAEVTTDRGYLNIMDGQPQVLVRKDSTAESARINCVLKERRLEQSARALGFDTSKVTYTAASTVTINDERKRLFGTAWAHLMGRTLTAASVVVTSATTTPVTYTEGVSADYVVDYTAGMIRRTANSTIDDGETVRVAYTWSRPGQRMLKFGSSITVKECSLVFIYAEPEGGNRVIYIFPRAIPSEALQESFRSGNLNTRNLSFDAVFEPTTPEGEGLYWVIHEGELANAYSEEIPMYTPPAPPVVPTSVLSTVPADDAGSVSIFSDITIVFDGPLSAISAENVDNYVITDITQAGSSPPGTATYNAGTYTVTLTKPLNGTNHYQVEVTAGVLDADGNPVTPYTFSFWTA